MKKGSFDLTGKAIDCRELPSMGDAGKEIFRALKLACNGVDEPDYGVFKNIPEWGYLVVDAGEYALGSVEYSKYKLACITPIDVLGQARVNAAKHGATLVFEGDTVPRHSNVIFYADGTKMHGCDTREYTLGPNHIVIAYKLLEEKQPSIESRILAEKLNTNFELSNLTHIKTETERLIQDLVLLAIDKILNVTYNPKTRRLLVDSEEAIFFYQDLRYKDIKNKFNWQ